MVKEESKLYLLMFLLEWISRDIICKCIFGHQTSFHLFRNMIERLSDMGMNTWQIPVLCFVALAYVWSSELVRIYCIILLLCCFQQNTSTSILTDKFCYLLFKLTSKCSIAECDVLWDAVTPHVLALGHLWSSWRCLWDRTPNLGLSYSSCWYVPYKYRAASGFRALWIL